MSAVSGDDADAIVTANPLQRISLTQPSASVCPAPPLPSPHVSIPLEDDDEAFASVPPLPPRAVEAARTPSPYNSLKRPRTACSGGSDTREANPVRSQTTVASLVCERACVLPSSPVNAPSATKTGRVKVNTVFAAWRVGTCSVRRA
jgi:hypothetical protein